MPTLQTRRLRPREAKCLALGCTGQRQSRCESMCPLSLDTPAEPTAPVEMLALLELRASLSAGVGPGTPHLSQKSLRTFLHSFQWG